LECYGRGGLSKPRCTRPGCDGEHTPGAHMLMGKGDAEVNLVAGDEDEAEAEDRYGYEDEYECEDGHEYECGGWWVGTVARWRHQRGRTSPQAPPPTGDKPKGTRWRTRGMPNGRTISRWTSI
jgi:hypothetical protein